jgi:AraC-like DNA-binding protein
MEPTVFVARRAVLKKGDNGAVDARGLRGAWADFQRMWSGEPGAALAPFVERYWAVTWDLRGQEPYRQRIVPYPNVHLTWVSGAEPALHGVARRQVVRVLDGLGHVFGVAFRPGGFRPWLGGPVSVLTDRTVDARTVLGPSLPQLVEDPSAMKHAVEAYLGARRPEPDPAARLAGELVARIAAEPDLARVDLLAERTGLGVRRLQRLFADAVGVGPKWVIRRYRLREVTDRIAQGGDVDWARLAVELGYADQAHFSRDFTAMFGEPPTQHALRYPRRQ